VHERCSEIMIEMIFLSIKMTCYTFFYKNKVYKNIKLSKEV